MENHYSIRIGCECGRLGEMVSADLYMDATFPIGVDFYLTTTSYVYDNCGLIRLLWSRIKTAWRILWKGEIAEHDIVLGEEKFVQLVEAVAKMNNIYKEYKSEPSET